LFTSCEKGISEFQSQNFIKFFGSGNESKGNCAIIADSDESSYLLVGSNKIERGGKNGIYAVKVDKFGNTIFEITYPNNDSIQEGSIVKKIDDGFIIIGTSQVNSSDYINPVLLKINSYGEIIWKKVIKKTYKLIINDFCIDGDNIFLVGESYISSAINPKCYIACYDLAGNYKWERTWSYGYNRKIFIFQNKLIIHSLSTLSGNTIQVIEVDKSGSSPTIHAISSAVNIQYVKDANYINGVSYIQINSRNSSESDTLKILKVNSDFSINWISDPILNISGKCMTDEINGEIFICGSYNNEIIFAKVDNNGTSYYGESEFKKYPGTAGSIINTPDNGLLVVGTTSGTYGTMVQLIKTDKDLYLLKP